MHRSKVLVVDDDAKILFAFRQVFRKAGYSTITARDGEEALHKISTEQPSVVFMDISMPKVDGLEVLKRMKGQHLTAPVVIITGYGTMQTAIKAVQLGAFEYLTKPLDVRKIREIAERTLAAAQSTSTFSPQRTQLKADFVDRYELIGNSTGMQEVYKLIGSVSTTPNGTPVLILGESGTGKELVARTIHSNGENAADPFVAINCTAFPETLLESELFGHEHGAFTGAGERKLGKFEVARAGTIFLDEIGNLSPHLQQKLLRVLQERELERLGGNDSIRVEARFIAATNRDAEKEVKQGRFREDLFYRLNVVAIHLPPLRDRKDDIPLLALYFLSKYNDQLKKSVKGFSGEAMAWLRSYRYPGNVRELENLIERAVMLAKGDIIPVNVFHDSVRTAASPTMVFPILKPSFSKSRRFILRQFEKQFVADLLTKHHGNVSAAARASKMTRQNFQRLMSKHNIHARPFRK
ncbi:MAG: sigma-54-dependent Fis family transcriptional regulator [Ignavibacteriales bacterium]|nr:sigma-54-dependent Fis family transcriptional regulator [Ignavibacteriales bacterium]